MSHLDKLGASSCHLCRLRKAPLTRAPREQLCRFDSYLWQVRADVARACRKLDAESLAHSLPLGCATFVYLARARDQNWNGRECVLLGRQAQLDAGRRASADVGPPSRSRSANGAARLGKRGRYLE